MGNTQEVPAPSRSQLPDNIESILNYLGCTDFKKHSYMFCYRGRTFVLTDKECCQVGGRFRYRLTDMVNTDLIRAIDVYFFDCLKSKTSTPSTTDRTLYIEPATMLKHMGCTEVALHTCQFTYKGRRYTLRLTDVGYLAGQFAGSSIKELLYQIDVHFKEHHIKAESVPPWPVGYRPSPAQEQRYKDDMARYYEILRGL